MEIVNCNSGLYLMLWFLAWFSASSECSNILFVSSFGSISHVKAITPSMEALSARGHNVTYLTIFVPKFESENNVTVLKINQLISFLDSKPTNFFEYSKFDSATARKHFQDITDGGCANLLTDPNFQRVAHDNGTRYDAIIMDSSNIECALSLVWLLNYPPLIYYGTGNLYFWIATSLGIPTPFSFVPMRSLITDPLTDMMSFLERFTNAISMSVILLYRYYVHFPAVQRSVQSIYPSAPWLLDIERNASFVFANSHSASVDFSRPLAPFYAEVGGTHCNAAKPLPKELQDFIEVAGDEGFIYFSLGTCVRAADMPKEKLNLFIKAFKRLKQQVIWKFEYELDDLPSNIRIIKWVPQQDVLGHPKIKAFLTQGGQLSIQEAVYHTVPILGLPVFGDQFSNVRNMVDKGMGEELNFDFDEETLYNKLVKLISDKSYKDNCLYYSKLIRDRPMKAIDTIVYWVEYVIRHKGAQHLHFNTQHLNMFEYFLLDVIIVFLLMLVITTFILMKIFKMTTTCMCVYTSESKYRKISKKNTMKMQ